MANTSKTTVVRDALDSNYKKKFISQCGDVDLSSDAEVDAAYNCIASAIGQFERTKRFAQFSSKYDEYLSTCIDMGNASDTALDQCAEGQGGNAETAGNKVFSSDEWEGLQLFMGDNNNDGVYEEGEGAACAACHVANWSHQNDYSLNVQKASWAPEGRVPPVFSDFTYDNLGIPKSEDPLLINNDVDFGLGTHLGIADENGKFKVSTLRNISATAPYGHNGFFSTLKSITQFYNTRDVGNAREAEVPETMNISEMGNLGLSEKQEDQLVVFIETLKDGYFESQDD